MAQQYFKDAFARKLHNLVFQRVILEGISHSIFELKQHKVYSSPGYMAYTKQDDMILRNIVTKLM